MCAIVHVRYCDESHVLIDGDDWHCGDGVLCCPPTQRRFESKGWFRLSGAERFVSKKINVRILCADFVEHGCERTDRLGQPSVFEGNSGEMDEIKNSLQ
jgi:hypothetical protein